MSGNKTRAFRPGVHTHINCYVYRLVDPITNDTFYIGKGTGNRVFQHFDEADGSSTSTKAERIRRIWAAGRDVSIVIHRHGLSDVEAFLVESVLIDLLPNVQHDAESRTNQVAGHHTSALGAKTVEALDHQYAAIPAVITQPIALIKINRKWLSHYKSVKRAPSDAEVFGMVRGDWVINPERHSRVRFCAAVAFGLIRQVYEIASWSSKDDRGRVSFEGSVSGEMASLVGTHVNDIFSPGAQAPVRWFYPSSLITDAETEQTLLRNGN